MLGTGLAVPGTPPYSGALGAPPGATPSAQPSARVINIGGFLSTGNQAAALAMDRRAIDAQHQAQQNQAVISGLAGFIRSFYNDAKDARQVVEQEMIEAMLARRGEYTNDKKNQIREQRQPAIYMMLAASKMRQIESLLRDTLIGTGAEKPWTMRPTPVPDLPPSMVAAAVTQLTMEIQQAAMTGFPPSVEAAQERLRQIKKELQPLLMELAQEKADNMERKMEDQLLEGGFMRALDEFITDLATFKTAFIAGPLVRRKPQLGWTQMGTLEVRQEFVLEWERVDPFDIFPARWAADLQRDPFIRKHRLSRSKLNQFIGVEGFSEPSIRRVLELYDRNGLTEWQSIDIQKATAEGKQPSNMTSTGLIDALQSWGSASGRMLIEWGLDPAQVPDPDKEYEIEAWLVGPHVIKAVLNGDPLARRPVYHHSFQTIPGSLWGNAPYDLMRDCQDMCNAAARALAANMGIASGPQAAILANRIPAGEEVTEMFPWKIWQFESDPMGSTAAPITFFQPNSNANELMTVYERFALLADEYTGIPRYMAGFNGGEGGAGRTASGISMMITNASKVIKQVLGGIDVNVLQLALERLYYHNMMYSDDEDLKGDVKIVARGAASLITKEAAQVRNNEMLQVALNSPIAQQIMGIEGVAELLRGAVKTLDHNPDRVVPPLPVLKQRMAEQQMAAIAAAGAQPGGTPEEPGGGENLQDGTPTTDNYSPR